MDTSRNLGELWFRGANLEEKLKVYWSLFQGDFDQDSWKASISFSEDYNVPQGAIRILSNVLEDESIQVLLDIGNGHKIECVIHSIVDLSDNGVIEISSPNLGKTRFILAQ